MKKYIIIIASIGLILGSIIVYNIFQVQKQNTKFFTESGYVLQNKAEQKVQEVERYYFSANESYKNKYNQKVIFEDTKIRIE